MVTDPRRAAAMVDTFALIGAAMRGDHARLFSLADEVVRGDLTRETLTLLAAYAAAWCKVTAQIQGADPAKYLDADAGALLAMLAARESGP